MNQPLAPANESLIQFLRIGADMVNREELEKHSMSSRPASQNLLMDNSIAIKTITIRAKHYINLAGFYKTVLGLEVMEHDKNRRTILLGRNNLALIRVIDGNTLPEHNKREPGLFHFALLYPHESALASALLRVSYYNPELYRGSADNGVSTSFYLEDTEGNGIELYADRNRNSWKWRGDNIQIGHKDVDFNDFIQWRFNPKIDESWDKQPLRIGHIHFQVGSVNQAKIFYKNLLGFNNTLDLPSVSFFSTAGYHQHFSVNSWNCRNLAPRNEKRGLETVEVVYGDENYMSALQRNVQKTSYKYWTDDNKKFCLQDPLTNVIFTFSYMERRQS